MLDVGVFFTTFMSGQIELKNALLTMSNSISPKYFDNATDTNYFAVDQKGKQTHANSATWSGLLIAAIIVIFIMYRLLKIVFVPRPGHLPLVNVPHIVSSTFLGKNSTTTSKSSKLGTSNAEDDVLKMV